MNRSVSSVFIVAMLLGGFRSVDSQAQVFDWQNTGGGSFGDTANWNPGAVPGSEERALFDLGQNPAYTVTLDQTRTSGSLLIRTDRVILDLNGFNLTLDGPTSPAADFTDTDNTDDYAGMSGVMVARGMGIGDHDVGTFTIRNSHPTLTSTLVSESLQVGGTSSSTGTVIIEGPRTVFNVTSTNANHVLLAVRGTGHMIVRDEATVNLSRFRLGRRAGGSTVTVEDAGTLLNIAGLVEVGYRGAGEVIRVKDGGEIRTGQMMLAPTTRTATMIVESGGKATSSSVQVGRQTSVGTIRIRTGGTYTTTTSLSLGTGLQSGWTTAAGGIVEVDGTGSRLDVGTSLTLGGTGTTDKGTQGDVTVSAGGVVTVGTYLFMGQRGMLAVDGGTVEVAQNLTATEGAEYALTLHTGVLAAPVTQTSASHAVSLNDMTLTLKLSAGFTAGLDEEFGVLGYAGALDGTFDGLPQGATVWDEDNLYAFQIDYGSGSGDAITLTVIPEPGTVGLLLAAGALLALRRRR